MGDLEYAARGAGQETEKADQLATPRSQQPLHVVDIENQEGTWMSVGADWDWDETEAERAAKQDRFYRRTLQEPDNRQSVAFRQRMKNNPNDPDTLAFQKVEQEFKNRSTYHRTLP